MQYGRLSTTSSSTNHLLHFEPTLIALTYYDSYLELALNSQLDLETRENLSQSHEASKASQFTLTLVVHADNLVQSLLFTINDLLVSAVFHSA